MGDVPQRGASTILAPFQTSEGIWIRASAVSSNNENNKVVVLAAQRNASRPFEQGVSNSLDRGLL
eukprot:489119-Pelagomonas_calceolata.AAC.1